MLPLVSSEQVLAALERLGCYYPRLHDGSHRAVCRDVLGRTLTQVVPLNKNPVRRGTLKTILEGLAISEDAFMIALGGKHRRAALRRRRRRS
jgi:predicted RNA binding protein YcfA (HicA-like mRNA interferase family)